MQKKPLVLIVDDLKSNRMIIKKVLKDSYDFIEATDGLEALNLLHNFTPDIILIDAIMPNMDGFETIKEIRKQKKYKRTPILMITSLSNIKIKIKALEYGVNDFLSKPFDKYELRARCKSYVEMVQLNKQFSDAKINPITKYKNEIALVKEILPTDSLFLFFINDFYQLDGLYGYKNSKTIEKFIALEIIEIIKKHIGKFEFYHVGSAKFVIKVDKSIVFEEQQLELLCKAFYDECSDMEITYENIKFTPIPTIVYTKDRINLYEDAISALSYAYKENIKYIFSSNEINGVKDIFFTNAETIKKVQDALENKRIINYYQPIFNYDTQVVTKYETLVRLKCPNNKILSPFFFLDLTKNTKLYEKITTTVYKNAFDKFKFNNDEFSINISYLDISNNSVREYLLDILRKNPHVSSRIIFELLEDETIKDFGLVKEFVQEVRKYEAKIAIDDFGSGYSNFERILQVEPDFLKIDGSIVKHILEDGKYYTLLENLNTFAHSLGIKTIAEFVSSKEIFEEVQNIGIDFAQGYFIGEPKSNLVNKSIFAFA